MYLIIPHTHKVNECKEWIKPADYAFMEDSEKVLADIPNTWKQYPQTIPGMAAIIDMEYKEFKEATTAEAMSHELVHLASACLHLWRTLNNVTV